MYVHMPTWYICVCEGVGEGVCWFDEANSYMLVEMNRGKKQGTRKAECWSV